MTDAEARKLLLPPSVAEAPADPDRCPRCNGTGEMHVAAAGSCDMDHDEKCDRCGGTGRVAPRAGPI